MPQALVVCHHRDGELVKGYTDDFSPTKPSFHVVVEKEEGPVSVEITISDLKAVFFVKSLEGRKDYKERKDFSLRPPVGVKVAVKFYDGEVVVGTAMGYSKDRSGFFMNPIDPESNNERIYVVSSSVKKVYVGADAEKVLEELKEGKGK